MNRPWVQIAACLAAITVVLLFERFTTWDLCIQDRFYDRVSGQWMITPPMHALLSPVCYKGIKIAVGILCISCVVVAVLSFSFKRLLPYRLPAAILACSIALVPLCVAGAKRYTNVYTPAQLSIYGGEQPYVPVLGSYPAGFTQESKGRGFPAGHSTAGFALMALYFCFSTRRARFAGLATGILLGWITGMYQTLRGEHFVSHTMVSMFASWIIILAVAMGLRALFRCAATYRSASCLVDES